MLWVYGHYKYLFFYSVGIDFSRHILTSVGLSPHDALNHHFVSQKNDLISYNLGV